MKPVTLGVVVGTRGFFPGHLAETGRQTVLDVLAAEGIKTIALGAQDTPYGSVESVADAQKCADLFKAHREEIDGILVTLPNFGDERAIANAIRWSGLDVPVLVHAFSDDAAHMTPADRRDSFCGKMSVCNNLHQYGIKYSLTALHTVDPKSASFLADLRKFVSTCRVTRGLRKAPRRPDRRAAGELHHRPLQREALRARRHLRRDRRPLRDLRPRRPAQRRRRRGQGQARPDQGLRAHRRHPRPRPRTDGQARRGDRWLDGRKRAGCRARCSAGPPWRSSTASCRAPS